MNYSFQPGENFADDFRRIADEQLAAAQDSLRNEPAPEAIHNARKRLKRTRALYRLASRDAGDFRQQENVRIRDMARTLSRDRDAVVLVETAAFLGQEAGSAPKRNAMKRIEDRLAMRRHATAAEDDAPQARITTAIETCDAARRALAQAKIPTGRKTAAKNLATARKAPSTKSPTSTCGKTLKASPMYW